MNTEDHIESRFAHLIRPIRDLAANWDVDIASELDDYLAELGLAQVEEDDIMNFSEAALLIEGSASIYSKKVEYLYALIFNKLDKIITKSKSKQNDVDIEELEDFDNDSDRTLNPLDDFVSLTLDNDLNIKLSTSSNHTTKKILQPLQSSLFVGFDSSSKKDVMSTDSNFLSICHVQDNGILLLKQDIEPKFNFKDIEDPFVLNSSLYDHSLQFESQEITSHGKEDVSMDIEHENFVDSETNMDVANDETNFESSTYHSPYQNKKRSDDQSESNSRNISSAIDPWEEHDPHDPGKKESKPFKKGKTIKIIKSDVDLNDIQENFKSIHDINVITLNLMKPFLSEFDYIYNIQTKNLSKRLKKNIKKEIHDIEKNEGLIADEKEYDIPIYDNIDINDYDNIDEEESKDDSNEDQFSYGTNMDIIELGIDDEKQYTYEELCKIHIEKHFVDSQKYILETDLTKRVSEWNEKIHPILEEQDKRKAFDIKSYGEEFKESIPEEKKEEDIKFEELVKEKEPFEVCRYFTAMLQLVNSGEIELKAEKKNEIHEIYVRLLV